jgi:hypothetical protein
MPHVIRRIRGHDSRVCDPILEPAAATGAVTRIMAHGFSPSDLATA